jgi:hypothetical protein
MRRIGLIVALGALLGMLAGAVTASPALAGRGHKWELLQAEPFILPADFCGFQIMGTPVAGKEYAKVLKASDGSMTLLSTGVFKIAYTNLETGKTLTENVSGPAKLTFLPDGSVVVAGKGNAGIFLAPADQARFGLPGLFISAGPLTISMDAAGNITSLSLNGHVKVDMCAALS